ncbi:MAG: hypothetical protein DRQ44_16785, partial [Gammaproteobacteria bacterium]
SKPDLNNWELWLKQYISTYSSIQPINTDYFNNDNRVKYWERHKDIISVSVRRKPYFTFNKNLSWFLFNQQWRKR